MPQNQPPASTVDLPTISSPVNIYSVDMVQQPPSHVNGFMSTSVTEQIRIRPNLTFDTEPVAIKVENDEDSEKSVHLQNNVQLIDVSIFSNCK